MRTRQEQETIIRWDRTDDPAILWTAAPGQAKRWERLGYPVTRETGGWRADVPKKLVTLRRFSSLTRPRRGQRAGAETSLEKSASPEGFSEVVEA